MAPQLDGTWTRLLPGPERIIKMRDPNDGQDDNPARKRRHQYRLVDGVLLGRTLPPEAVGDAWRDVGVPPWTPVAGGEWIADLIRDLG